MEIHTDITKEEAYQLMEEGHKVAHEYYTEDEFLYMRNGMIFDENGYKMGTKTDKFWSEIQKWPRGWRTFNGS